MSHDLHGLVDMCKKTLVGRAKVVETVLPVGRLEEPVFGTLSVAREADFALAAVGWERLRF